MASLRDEILERLSRVSGPDGVPLPASGKLSEIVAGDGKVFFSITVEAGEVKAWESVRERAEAAVRALSGVRSVMIALTAERAGGGAPLPRPVLAPVRAPANSPGRSSGHGGGHGAAPAHGHAPGAARGPGGPAGIPGVAAIIAVASGKGGVG